MVGVVIHTQQHLNVCSLFARVKIGVDGGVLLLNHMYLRLGCSGSRIIARNHAQQVAELLMSFFFIIIKARKTYVANIVRSGLWA